MLDKRQCVRDDVVLVYVAKKLLTIILLENVVGRPMTLDDVKDYKFFNQGTVIGVCYKCWYLCH